MRGRLLAQSRNAVNRPPRRTPWYTFCMTIQLTDRDQAMLSGNQGAACQMAMRILCTMAEVFDAPALLDIESAHIDGCLYHGLSGLEFAERLADGGAQTVVPTTLNVGAYDLLHPELFQGSDELGERAKRLMLIYRQMGCRPVFTCAPYQLAQRPAVGMQIAWAESNAIVFANSVLGARTNRYGDFIDICAAITGRAPAYGLHLTEHRRGEVVFDLSGLPDELLEEDVLFPVLGYFVGMNVMSKIPVIVGLPPQTNEDQLKALGAAAASSGAVALFHAVGITPEAPTLADALQQQSPIATRQVSMDDLRDCRRHLSTAADGPIQVVALGSPHFSLGEFAQLLPLLEAYPPSRDVEFIVCTNRFVLDQLQQRGWEVALQTLGVKLIVDTCVVVTPIMQTLEGTLMTNSGKFAHYTPGNTGLGVVFGSLVECVLSAQRGVVRREHRWI